MDKKTISIDGMTCNHCKMNVEKTLSALKGISRVSVDLQDKSALIEGEDIDLKEIEESINSIGYTYKGEK